MKQTLLEWLPEQKLPFPQDHEKQVELANAICKVYVPKGIGLDGDYTTELENAITALGYSGGDAHTIAQTVSTCDREYAYSYVEGQYIVVVIITTID